MERKTNLAEAREVRVSAAGETLLGNLNLPRGAQVLNEAGLGTLLLDLLTIEEERVDLRTRQLRFNISWLAERLIWGCVESKRRAAMRDNDDPSSVRRIKRNRAWHCNVLFAFTEHTETCAASPF